MARLEAEVGMSLLKRGPQGILTTTNGDILYCHARMIREEVELATRDLLNAREKGTAPIRIGGLPSLSSKILPLAMGRWRETHQEELEVVESAQFDLLAGLIRRDFDFVIGFTKVFDMLDGLRQRVLFRDTLRVITSPAHPLRAMKSLNWVDLLRYPWVSPTSSHTHTVLERILPTVGAPSPRITVCGSVSLLKSLVSETDHLALLPAHAVREEVADQRLYVLPFHDPTLARDIAIFVREGYDMDQPRRELVSCITEVGLELCHHNAADPDERYGEM